jgi:UDP-N-acetylmuramate-alanine ligase
MNIRNAAMAAVAADHFGVRLEQSAVVLSEFRGVVHRQDTHEAGTCTLVRDKATHPVALSALLEGLRQKYPGRRLVSVVLPRATGGRAWLYQRELPLALAAADMVLLLEPYEHNPEPGRTWQGGTFSTELLMEALMEGPTKVVRVGGTPGLEAALAAHLRPHDVLVLSLPEQADEIVVAATRAAGQV